MKTYNDNQLNPVKKNIDDPRKEMFVQALSVSEILAELQIAKDYCSIISNQNIVILRNI